MLNEIFKTQEEKHPVLWMGECQHDNKASLTWIWKRRTEKVSKDHGSGKYDLSTLYVHLKMT